MKPKTTKKEFLDFFYSLSTEEALKIVKEYDKKHKTHLSKELEKLQVSEIERKLLEIGVNSTCPYCNSNKIVKRGRDANFQRYYCKECQKSFVLKCSCRNSIKNYLIRLREKTWVIYDRKAYL